MCSVLLQLRKSQEFQQLCAREQEQLQKNKKCIKYTNTYMTITGNIWCFFSLRAYLGAQWQSQPVMQQLQMWVQSLSWKDSLEEGMITHSSILAWRIPWIGEPGEATVHGVAESDMTEATQHACFPKYQDSCTDWKRIS